MHFDLQAIIENLGYAGVALAIFAESGLFFGFFLPGDSLLFTAGFLASQGFFSLPILILITIPAAILGDSVGYWFGAKVGPHIFTRENSFWFDKKRITDAENFFERYGRKSLLLARFVPAVRTFTPIVAGVGKMRYASFLTWNAVGGFLWGGLIPLLGYFLGRAVPDPDRYILPAVGVIIILSLIPIAREFLRSREPH